jgi:hypothetical protein
MPIDMHRGSDVFCGRGDAPPEGAAETTARINALLDGALVARGPAKRRETRRGHPPARAAEALGDLHLRRMAPCATRCGEAPA